MEVATAIANAKQASANVLIAQQQVQAAKENVLHQQRIAAEKEAHSSILTQKSETVAAIQRSEAAAAAQSVILAQQRLAAAKNAVSQQQRIASAQEAKAATALHNSAHAAAAEIRRTGTSRSYIVFISLISDCKLMLCIEQQAARLAAIQRTGSAASAHHLSATKDSAIGPINAGNNHVQNYPLALSITPWNNFAAATNGAHSIGGGWPSATTVYVPPSSAGGSTSFKPSFNMWG